MTTRNVKFDEDLKFFTTYEVAEMLHSTTRLVGLWRRKGMLKGIRTSYGYVYRADWIKQFTDAYEGYEVSNEAKCDIAIELHKRMTR